MVTPFQIIAIFMVIFSVVEISSGHKVPGYYWRDFYGKLPEDAFPGGTDTNENPIYIGQILSGNLLIPAQIYTNDNKAYYEYGGLEHTVTTNIKILCTQNPSQFAWIKTNNDDIGLLTDKHLVIGGYEPGATTYIGRARSGGEVVVGKVLTDNFFLFKGLHVTSKGKKTGHTSFEVLDYNPEALRTDITHLIDIRHS